MALVNIPYIYYPAWPGRALAAPSLIGLTIDAAGEKVGAVVQATATATIRKVGFRVHTVTSSGDVNVRLETVDAATGLPTGTLLHASADVTVTISSTGWKTADFGSGNGGAVTRGSTIFAVVIQDDAASAPNIQISYYDDETLVAFPYVVSYISSWGKVTTGSPNIALEFADGTYMVLPTSGVLESSITTAVFSNASTPDHRGLRFKNPFNCRVAGAWIWTDFDGNADIELYDSDGTTVLQTASIDDDVRNFTDGRVYPIWFDGSEELTIDTFYRVVVAPTTTTSVRYYEIGIDSTAIMDSRQGGQNFHATSKKDAGWTDDTTAVPTIGLIIDQLDDGAGGGGGVAHLAGDGGGLVA